MSKILNYFIYLLDHSIHRFLILYIRLYYTKLFRFKKESTNSLREVGHAMFSLELELRRRAPF